MFGLEKIMISKALFVLFLAYHSFAMTPEFSDSKSFQERPKSEECKVATNVSSHLNLAIEIIKNVRDSHCECASADTLPSDCEDVLQRGHTISGIYKILPRSRVVQNPIEVYCDMTTDKGGWTVIQRRGDFQRSADYFFKDWQSYKNGFGNVDKDFWLGNDNIFALSNQKLYSVRFDLKDVEGKQAYAVYDTFWIDDENNKYMLHIDGYRGDAGNSMITHNNMKFSTKDQQNDNIAGESCAMRFKGGWWYDKCHGANLNGLYHKGKHESYADGVNWSSWKGNNESLEWTEIKIRSKDFRQ